MSQVYATGAVTGTGGSPSAVGGLVGFNGNSITQSYWDSYTTGQVSGVGSGGSAGVTAVTSDPAQSAAANYAYKQSAYSSFSFPGTGTTGWFMVDGQTRPFGRWEYQTTITNPHQLQLMAIISARATRWRAISTSAPAWRPSAANIPACGLRRALSRSAAPPPNSPERSTAKATPSRT